MAGKEIYRASTTAPVNIAVIKCFICPNAMSSFTNPSPIQILGKTRPNTQPTHEFFPLRHPLPKRPPHPHDSILLSNLQPARHSSPQLPAARCLRRSHTSLLSRAAITPTRPRKKRPVLTAPLDLPSAHSIRKQLPHRRRSCQQRRRLRSSRPRNRRPLPTSCLAHRPEPNSPARLGLCMPQPVRWLRSLEQRR